MHRCNGTQGAINHQAEVDCQSAVGSQNESTVVGEHEMYSTCGSIDLNASPEYSAAFDSWNEGTVVAHNFNRPIPDTKTTPTSTSVKEDNNEVDCLSSLTEATLAAHDQYLSNYLLFYEVHASGRVDDILQAARGMGFDLPRACFELDKWDMPEWIEAQIRLRA